jgi:hypothetical protein
MKKEILIPVLLLFLGLIFVIINIIVYFTKGNTWIVSKKLRVGALILTLTSIVACHSVPKPTCYDVAISPSDGNSDSIAVNTKDSIAKIQPIKPDSIRPTCYEMPAPRKNDTLSGLIEEKQINESNTKTKSKNKKEIKQENPVRPICYGAPANINKTQ